MAASTINPDLILDLEQYAPVIIEDGLLLALMRAQHPRAPLSELRRAALSIVTDPIPANPGTAIRMSKFVKSLRQ